MIIYRLQSYLVIMLFMKIQYLMHSVEQQRLKELIRPQNLT